MTDPRIVCCSDYDYENGWGDRDTGPCPYCEGTGGEIIETQPIEMEDLP